MTVSAMWKLGLAAATVLTGSSAHATVSSGPSPITGKHQIYQRTLIDAAADLSSFIEHFGSFAAWAGLAIGLFVCLWSMRTRLGRGPTGHHAPVG